MFENDNYDDDVLDATGGDSPKDEEGGGGYTLPDSEDAGSGDMSADELDSRIDAIAKQLTLELRRTARHKYDALLEERSRLYAQRYPETAQDESDQAGAEAPSLHQQAAVELAQLKALGFDGKPPKDIEPRHIEAWRCQRLNAENNYDELAPLLRADMQAIGQPHELTTALETLLRVAPDDAELCEPIIEIVINRLFELKKKG